MQVLYQLSYTPKRSADLSSRVPEAILPYGHSCRTNRHMWTDSLANESFAQGFGKTAYDLVV